MSIYGERESAFNEGPMSKISLTVPSVFADLDTSMVSSMCYNLMKMILSDCLFLAQKLSVSLYLGITICSLGNTHTAYERTHRMYRYAKDECGPMYV